MPRHFDREVTADIVEFFFPEINLLKNWTIRRDILEPSRRLELL